MFSVRQEMRPTMIRFISSGIESCCRTGRTAGSRDFEEPGKIKRRRKDNDAILIPCSTPAVRRITDPYGSPTRSRYPLELAGSKKTNELIIRRPERKLRAICFEQLMC